jgi:hypothetical protein
MMSLDSAARGHFQLLNSLPVVHRIPNRPYWKAIETVVLFRSRKYTPHTPLLNQYICKKADKAVVSSAVEVVIILRAM